MTLGKILLADNKFKKWSLFFCLFFPLRKYPIFFNIKFCGTEKVHINSTLFSDVFYCNI